MNQLAVIDQQSNGSQAYRASTDAASLCKDIVVNTATTIQGRKYVGVEGWQAIALAHGCAAGSRDVERIEGGVRAVGEVRRMMDGAIIAIAEGFVGEDEPTWFGGDNGRGKILPKRPDYAIRAMAQTRAISRACRSAFAHVVVMMNAGLATTPAEEVPLEGFDNQEPKVPGIHKIKERLHTMMTAGNDPTISLDQFKELKRKNKDDLKAIRDANHEWWVGDGEDFEGYGPWIARRETELSQPDDGQFHMLVESMKECETKQQLTDWLELNLPLINTLDDIDRRKFEQAKDYQESIIDEQDKVRA